MEPKKYSPEFEYLWKKWPKRWNRNKSVWVKRKKFPAWKAWQKLDEETQRFILSVLNKARENEGAYPRDLVTWLNQQGWEDLEFQSDYVPVLPKELTDKIGHSEALKEVDPNLQRTINLRRLRGGA